MYVKRAVQVRNVGVSEGFSWRWGKKKGISCWSRSSFWRDVMGQTKIVCSRDAQRVATGSLQLNLVMHYEIFEKFQMAHNFHTITTTILIPLAEPEERNNLILREPVLFEGLCFRYGLLNIGNFF